VLDLRAAPLEGRTLAEALAALAAEWSQKSSVPAQFGATGVDRRLPLRVEASLFRAAQEGLSNIARHARARRAAIQLDTAPDQVRLVIKDDGRGFDSSQIPQGRFGLVGLNERVRLLGGKLSLESSPGQGTRIEVTIPLERRT